MLIHFLDVLSTPPNLQIWRKINKNENLPINVFLAEAFCVDSVLLSKATYEARRISQESVNITGVHENQISSPKNLKKQML